MVGVEVRNCFILRGIFLNVLPGCLGLSVDMKVFCQAWVFHWVQSEIHITVSCAGKRLSRTDFPGVECTECAKCFVYEHQLGLN